MKAYTEEQKFSNYKFLVRSVHELRAGRKVTDDDIQYFKHIRYYCKDFEYSRFAQHRSLLHSIQNYRK